MTPEKNFIFELNNAHNDISGHNRLLLASAEKMVNSFSFDAKKTAQMLVDQYPLMPSFRLHVLTLAWINHYGDEKKNIHYDGRNEAAIQKCRDIFKLPVFALDSSSAFAGHIDEAAIAGNFVAGSRAMHRTLMQSFTKFLFAYLDCLDGELTKDIRGLFDNDPYWWSLPMI